jgi:hypothetical protein
MFHYLQFPAPDADSGRLVVRTRLASNLEAVGNVSGVNDIRLKCRDEPIENISRLACQFASAANSEVDAFFRIGGTSAYPTRPWNLEPEQRVTGDSLIRDHAGSMPGRIKIDYWQIADAARLGRCDVRSLIRDCVDMKGNDDGPVQQKNSACLTTK